MQTLTTEKKKEKEYTHDQAEDLYWVWFQLKIKQAFLHLFLKMMGNVQAGFKSSEELAKLEEKRGGVKGMSSEDIFDKEKYIEMMKKEMN